MKRERDNVVLYIEILCDYVVVILYTTPRGTFGRRAHTQSTFHNPCPFHFIINIILLFTPRCIFCSSFFLLPRLSTTPPSLKHSIYTRKSINLQLLKSHNQRHFILSCLKPVSHPDSQSARAQAFFINIYLLLLRFFPTFPFYSFPLFFFNVLKTYTSRY